MAALTSPIDAGAGRSFAFHMLQHVVLATFAPPLIVLGLKGWPAQELFATPVGSLLRFATKPLLAAPLFLANMWFWHVPVIYDRAVSDLPWHISMHLAYIGTGLLFWWPLIVPRGRYALSPAGGLLYVVVSGFPMMILAFFLLASQNPIYESYRNAPIPWRMSVCSMSFAPFMARQPVMLPAPYSHPWIALKPFDRTDSSRHLRWIDGGSGSKNDECENADHYGAGQRRTPDQVAEMKERQLEDVTTVTRPLVSTATEVPPRSLEKCRSTCARPTRRPLMSTCLNQYGNLGRMTLRRSFAASG